MEFVKENKKVLIICLSLIACSLLLVLFVNKETKEENNNYSQKNTYLKNYKINEITPINMTEEQMARKYLAEYTKLLFNDPESAYSLVEEKYRDIKFNGFNQFEEYFNERFDINFFNGVVELLEVKKSSNFKEFYIIDSNKNTYIFREYSINNYKVLFDNYTI